MTTKQPWQEFKDEYTLEQGFALKRADKREFGIHETIYSNADLELSFSWKKQTVDKIYYDDHFWILKDGKRLGGVHIKPNLMGALFLEPPYLVDKFTVIRVLTNILVHWTGESERIRVYGIKPDDIEHYQKLGYRIEKERRVMIRPTEIFNDMNWGDDFEIRVPTMADAPEIGKLFFEGYTGGIDYEVFGQKSEVEATKDAEYILNIYQSNNTLDGSSLVYYKPTKELVGVCLAGISGFTDNDFSEIGEVVVKPEFRGLGIASKLIKQALTNLKGVSPATILCVTIGNPAERLYHNLGFFSGVKFTNMYLTMGKC